MSLYSSRRVKYCNAVDPKYRMVGVSRSNSEFLLTQEFTQPDLPQTQTITNHPKSSSFHHPHEQSARDMCPLWRDLILKIWGGDPL